jgi:hypothetical protein
MTTFPQPIYKFTGPITSNYAALSGDNVLANPQSAAITVTLPPSPQSNATVQVRNIAGSTYAVTVKTADGSTIDNIAGTTGIGYTTAHTGATFAYDGANWWVVGS